MSIIVILVILIIVYFQAKNLFGDKAKLARMGVILILIIALLSQIIKVVPAGKVKVKVLFGKVNERVLRSGLNFVNPLVNLHEMSIRTQDYTMSSKTYEGRSREDDAIKALSSDGILLPMDITCLFHLVPNKAPEVYEKLGLNYERKIIRPQLKTVIRDIVSSYPMEEIYSTKRDSIALAMRVRAKQKLEKRGIKVEDLLLRNVNLPKSVEQAINDKKTEQQKYQKMVYTLKKEEKEKERKVIEAQGIKEKNRTIAEGLTDQYLQWYKIDMMKQLIDSPNNTIIFIPTGEEISPIIDANQTK